MNININQNQLTVSDTAVTVSKYIHVVQHNTTTGPGTRYDKYTHDSSTTTLETDGYYTITQMMLSVVPTPGTYYILEDVVDQVIAPNGFPITITELLKIDPIVGGFARQDQD